MRRALPILAGVALTLGLVHLGLAALASGNWNAQSLWFAGSGLAIVIAALFNVAMIRADAVNRLQKSLWFLVNFLTTVFFAAAWPVLRQPQVIVGGAVFALLCVAVLAAPGPSSADRVRRTIRQRDAANG